MSDDNSEKVPVSSEAWPAGKPATYSSIESGEWGYLIVYSDGSVSFDKSKTPTEKEILDRWGYLFNK